ncbi:hypothetical protein FB45DRAFT_935758 [Roridomyces roridus]|uniref:GATA-type domain-containing protein n=1 Tax=Roridomyces roridus TaxID=1738132 RepID=A0AAD7FEG7_9AGAR|nr:hypothetical protein FB45DRAFT_935758 [Roridomyces roridus]
MSYNYGNKPGYIPTSYNSLREAGMSGQPQQAPQSYGMVAPAGVPSYPSSAQYPSTPYTSNAGQWAPQQPAASSAHSESYMANANAGMASPYNNAPPGQPYTPSASHPANHGGVKQCRHCGTMTTPLWRRDPSTHETLCSACGLYLQQRHEHRPQMLIDADREAEYHSLYGGGGGDGPECNHCHTRETSVWRRDKEGNQVCNACGVYQRLRGVPRPLELKRSKPKPRAKHAHS